jgi:ribonuclease HI
VAAACGHIHRIGSALQAEAIAVMQAMKISSQMGCSRVQLEMDTSILKNAITSTEYDLTPLGGHFKEIKAVMCNAFEDINVLVCKRSCNIVAHNLAV